MENKPVFVNWKTHYKDTNSPQLTYKIYALTSMDEGVEQQNHLLLRGM